MWSQTSCVRKISFVILEILKWRLRSSGMPSLVSFCESVLLHPSTTPPQPKANSSPLVGSSSPLLIMSGVLYEGVGPTAGQYGSVLAARRTYLGFCRHRSIDWTDLSPRQPYSIARVAILAAVLLAIINLDVRTAYNCQVGAMSHFQTLHTGV